MLTCNLKLTAQEKNIFRYTINLDNGLPANHSYYVLTDTLGYLWVSTTNGVVRYNGYNLKLFSKPDGISNDDIWNMHADRKGRIWLFGISNDLGYIKNDKYKKAWINDPEFTFYPRFIYENNDGIFFMNNAIRDSFRCAVAFEKNDSITYYPVHIDTFHYMYLNDKAELIYLMYNDFFKINYKSKNDIVSLYKHFDIPYSHVDSLLHMADYFSNSLHVYHNEQGPIYLFNEKTGKTSSISIYPEPGEKIIVFSHSQHFLKVITNKKILYIDTNGQIPITLRAETLFGNNYKDELTSMIGTSFWGNVATSSNNGFTISYDTNYFIKQPESELTGYEYVGYSAQGAKYWWNRDKNIRTLLRINPDGSRKAIKLGSTLDVYNVRPFNNNISIINSTITLTIDEKTLNVSMFFNRYRIALAATPFLLRKERTYMKYTNTINHFLDGTKYAYAITKGGGLEKYTITGDSISTTMLTKFRPVYAALDSNHKQIWIASNRSIYVYNMKLQKGFYITRSILDLFGINKVEYIETDKYSNIYIRYDDKLLLYNPRTGIARELFTNYKLGGCRINIHNDMLVLAGPLGVLFSQINGTNKVSAPIMYPNLKHNIYNYLIGNQIYVDNNTVILSTDKGIFNIPIPKTNNRRQYKDYTREYKLLLFNNDTVQQLNSHDTITLQPDITTIRFDLIKPTGYGNVVYQYRMGTLGNGWIRLNNNELHFDDINADTYYDLQLLVQDNDWRSNVIHVKLYLTPKWWQSYYGKRIKWLGILLSIIAVVLIVIAITKRVLDKRNEDRNMQLELKNLKMAVELKSIYAQINPHFIFNTLSSGLYFIRKGMMKEAYAHISNFSDLLRSFLKASRNKYVNLAEDIENLENYIKLQQTRFENKFEYSITVSPDVNPQTSMVPSLLIQPLVENAIHHGLFHSEKQGHLCLSFARSEDGALICSIDDDGIGREKSKALKEATQTKTQSYGTDMVKELINILNENEPIHISIEYIDKQPPYTGTTVIITIKYLEDAKP